MMRFLMAGVPQLISPTQVEAYMAAKRIEANGFGVQLRESSTSDSITDQIETVANAAEIASRVKTFAAHARSRSSEAAAARVCLELATSRSESSLEEIAV